MSAAAKRTVLAAFSILALVALVILVPAGGASSDRDHQAPTKPLNLRVTSATPSLVSVAWDPSTDDVGVKGYYVFGDKGKATVDIPEDVDKPSYTVTELGCGESTLLTVIAFDDAQNRSGKATLTVATAACRDTQPPSAPTGFAQLATTGSAVVLGWTPSSDNTGVVEYGVYRNLQRVSTTTEPDATLSPLGCGSTYTYLVDAADAAGNRSLQASVYVRTAACATQTDSTPPSTPTGLAASGITQTGLSLSWNASSDNVAVAGYDVYRNGTKVASPTTTNVSQSSLTCGTSYTLAVAARDAAGNVSQPAPLSVSTSACSPSPLPTDSTPPSTPTGLSVSAATGASVSLRWSASTDNVGVAGYRVYVNGAYATTTLQLSATVSGLACGSAYMLGVDAFDLEGNSSARASVTVSTTACPDTQAPSAPLNLLATSRTTTSIALSWSAANDNVGVVGYGLYRAGVQVGTSTTTTGIFSGLTCNTNYTLAVDAFDGAANRSSKSTVMVATTACPDTQPPSAPTGLAATNVTQTGLTLTWNPSSDNVGVTGYDVSRNGTKVATATVTSSSQPGLACGTSYAFSVVAKDAAGNSSGPAQWNTSTAPCLVSGTAYYVDPNGSDSADGSQSRPWKTLAKACATVPANQGATIVMAAGVYTESSTCNLPPKTNLQGAGGRNGATTIRGSADPLISLLNASDAANVQTVSGIKLDGQNKTAGTRGMAVSNVNNLTIDDMFSTSFKGQSTGGGALNLDGVTNCIVRNSEFRDSGAYIAGDNSSGSFGLGTATNCVFHDLVMHDTDRQCIKGNGAGYTLTNVEFYNLHLTTTWTGVYPDWDMVIELYGSYATNVRIHHSYLGGEVSLTDPGSQGTGTLPAGQYKYILDHNVFAAKPIGPGSSPPSNAIEIDQNSVEIHHNYFTGQARALQWNGTGPKTGIKFHHNVIDFGAADYDELARMDQGTGGIEFYENTYLARGFIHALWRDDAAQSPNVHDNIFSSSAGNVGDRWGTAGTAATNRNYFYNFTAKGTNATQAGTQPLPVSGGFPNAYLPASAAAASFGAFADGTWSVGPG